MAKTSPLALPPVLPSELLTYILTQQASPSTLIICQPRANFLESLLYSLPHTQPPRDENTSTLNPPRHPLLIPTLHQVATSRNINLVFVPSVSHLRAYLAVFSSESVEKHAEVGKRQSRPLLVVYGVVGLHRDTSEWGAQGLGNTLAAVVEAGHRSGRRVVIFEVKVIGDEPDYYNGDEEITEEEVREAKKRELVKGWEEEVPMLNGGAWRGKVGESEGGWSGRSVEVGRIIGRWFRFERGDWGGL